MKKLLAVTVLTLLTAGVAAAQTDMGNAPVPGATFTTGVVVSSAADSMVIRLDSGETMTMFLEKATVGGKNNAIGSRVQINYRLDNNSRPIAIEIRGSGPGATATTAPLVPRSTAPAPTLPSPTSAPAPPLVPSPTAPDVDVDVDTDANRVDVDADLLPATASNGPALALVGLLALGAAAVIRVVR